MGNWLIKVTGPVKFKNTEGHEQFKLDHENMTKIINDTEAQGFDLVNVMPYPVTGWGMPHLMLFFWRKEAGPCPMKMPFAGPARDVQLDLE